MMVITCDDVEKSFIKIHDKHVLGNFVIYYIEFIDIDKFGYCTHDYLETHKNYILNIEKGDFYARKT